jgi:hypothetical protein
MTRTLRQRHRRIFAVLGVALPVAFIIGMAARTPVPAVDSLPGEIAGEPLRVAARQWSRDDLCTGTSIQAALVRERAGSGRFAVELTPPKDFARPDLLVYWMAGGSTVTEAIPDDAILLGGLDGSVPLPFPPGSPPSNGMLILYSLADHEIVDVSKPFTF